MTRLSNDQCLNSQDSDAAGQKGPNTGKTGSAPTGEHLHGPNSGLNPIEARVLADAESVPTPPASTSGQPPQEDEEIEIDISSSTVRLFTGRLYLALPNVRPPGLREDEISDLIQHLETDLKAALGKIKAKSHRKPWKESSLIINMRMSGALEDGATKVKLKPCIWLFCGSRWCRKIIEKDVKKLNWRLPCGIQIVDKGGPLLAASEDSDEGYADDDPSDDDGSTCLAGPFNNSHSMPAFAPGHSHYAAGLDTTGGSEHGENISSAALSPSGSHRLEEQENILAWRAPLSPPNSVSAAPLSSPKSVGSGASSTPALPSRKNVVTYAIHRSGRSSNSQHDLTTRNVYLSGPGCRAMHRRSRASFSDSEHVAETNLKLLDDMVLEFYVQESPTNSALGLVCRSTIRTHRAIVSERFSRMGGVITVTRGLETTLYGVTSGHSLICQILEDVPSGTDDSRRSFDEYSDTSSSSGDSSSDDMSEDNRSHGHDPPPPYETTKKWINASQGLVATFVGLHADSRQFGMIPRETSVKSGGMVGDLALIKLPKHCARRLQNQFVEPVKPRDNSSQDESLNSPVIEADDGENELFVLLSKTRSVAGSRITGIFHFSVGGRKVETERIMLSEDLELGSSGAWVVENDVLYGMVIAVVPMERCALILPQKRMYSDIKEMFPDATSILVSSGIPAVGRPPIESPECCPRQVYSECQKGNTRGIFTLDGKGKGNAQARSLSIVYEQEKGTLVRTFVNRSASGPHRSRREPAQYYT